MNNPMNNKNDFYSEDFNEDDYYAGEEERFRSEEQIKLYIVAALVLVVVVSSVLIGVVMTKKGINPFGNPNATAASDDDSSENEVESESDADEGSGEDTLYSDDGDEYSGDDGGDTYTDDQNDSSDSFREDNLYQEGDSYSSYDETQDSDYDGTQDSDYDDSEDSVEDDTQDNTPDEPDELSFEDACLIVLSRKLTNEDIANIKKSAPGNLPETPIQMAINYLYAWHGYHFHTDAIRKYFLDTTWYVDEGRTIEQCEARMDSVEKSNLDKLVALRKQ